LPNKASTSPEKSASVNMAPNTLSDLLDGLSPIMRENIEKSFAYAAASPGLARGCRGLAGAGFLSAWGLIPAASLTLERVANFRQPAFDLTRDVPAEACVGKARRAGASVNVVRLQRA
jgi:hypothetical protein